MYFFFFFKQKTAYEVRISDWSSDVCSSDLFGRLIFRHRRDRVIEHAVDDEAKAMIDEDPLNLHLRLAFGELEAVVLHIENRLAERMPTARIIGGRLDRLLADRDGAARDDHPFPGEFAHEHIEENGRGAGRERVCHDV